MSWDVRACETQVIQNGSMITSYFELDDEGQLQMPFFKPLTCVPAPVIAC